MSLTQALNGLSGIPDPGDRVDAIKKAVATTVKKSDPSAAISFTPYFNHAAVPDMVLTWPRTSTQRFLYLRGAPNIRLIADGLPFLTGDSPLIVTLNSLPEPRHDATQDTQAASAQVQQSGTWIADPPALDTLNTQRANKAPSTTLLSHALIEGGRGVTNAEAITQLIEGNERGFQAAATGEPDGTGWAVQQLAEALSPSQAARMHRVLRAVWEGHGGQPSQFPSSDSHGSLTDDDLIYLLNSVDTESANFWAHLGRRIAAEQLARLHVDDYSAGLQHLIEANLPTLRIKGLRVLQEPPYIGEPTQTPRWIADGRLSLRGDGWRAYIAARKAEELPAADEAGRPLPLQTLRQRAEATGALVTHVEFGNADTALIYESRNGSQVLDDEQLTHRATEVFSDAIKSAVLSPPGSSGSARADFEEVSVIGQTNSTFPANTLIRTALLILLELTDEEKAALESFLPDEHPPTLFDSE